MKFGSPCLLALLLLLPTPAWTQTRLLELNSERFIEVSGQANVDVTPDFVRVTLGVTTTGKDAREALAANAKSVNAVISLMKAEGLLAADIQTSSLSISPLMANPSPGSTSTRTITGYSVSNMVTVTVRDISQLGALIDNAVDAGANAIYGISFGEKDPSALLDKARPLAVADAKRKADIYASAGGAKTGRLMTLTEEIGAPPPMQFARAYVQGAAATPTPIEAGQDKLTITVTARFELTQ
jgi:uncharacterized protein YggE